MGECFKCRVEGERIKLFEVISSKGIIKICEKCFSKENLPLIKKSSFELEESPKKIDLKNLSLQSKKPEENTKSWLVDNFHWVIMRKRRSKHITQIQLAKAIDESEATIKDVEKGIIQKYNFKLINKLENYFDIKLTKINNPSSPAAIEKTQETPAKIHSRVNQEITISDLQKIKQEKDAKEFTEDIPEIKELETDQKKENEKELTQEEINKLIFGK